MTENEKKNDKEIGGMSLSGIAYSIIKKASIVGVIYIAGYLNCSVAWFITPIILLAIREQTREDSERRRNIAKATSLTNEKDVLLARIQDLPAWVYFPDVERAEWLNMIIKQCWPNVNHYAREIIRDKIQPTLAKSLNKIKLSGFRFERIILGSVPPRIGGIKVYEKNVSRNEIIMDIDIFYSGDCDITFFLQGIKAGVKDFQLHGMLRIIMKPLITTVPIVGGLQVFFLNNPSIDFNLVGVADILDMPGLSDMLRRIITEQVASLMVLPNKLPIKLSDIVEAAELKAPEPEGVLRVHLIQGKNLMRKDIGMLGKGKSDPYAIVTVGAQEFRTKTIQSTVDPKWDFWCEFDILQSDGQQLYLHLWDFDDTSDDEALGRATVELSNVIKKGEDDMWITLEQAKHGMVHIRLAWLTLSSNYSDLEAALAETQYLRVTSMSTALLVVFVDSARSLPQARTSSQPDPFVVFTLYKESKQTAVEMRTSDPVWEEGFTFLVNNPETDTVYIRINDQKTSSELGSLDLNLNSLFDKANLEIVKQPFRLLKSGPESKLILSFRLRILKNTSKAEMQMDQPEFPVNDSPSSVSNANLEQLASTVNDPVANLLEAEADSLPESIEEGLTKEISPLLSATPSASSTSIIHRTPSVTSSIGEAGLGRIQLTLRYSVQRQRLTVVVNQVANLPLKDPSNIPDPYVKLYLLPGRSKDSKRKTAVIKDNCNAVFDEKFEYLISQGELNSQQLEVTVCTQKQLFYSSSNVMGQVIIDLSQWNLMQPLSSWFDLQPEK